ncbi:MAG: pectate lyase, partial [Muribaculaceae bacterium]|nr:pectate lyase [Muribaculaceae bacterium]
MYKKILGISLAAMACMQASAEFPITVKDGQIEYLTDARGNRLLDYSTCGYRNSSAPIPDYNNVIFVEWRQGDNSDRIQRAIDHVASLPVDRDGVRGAVLLDKGEFEISKPLRITTSGIALRGSGETATSIKKTGVDRGALIYIEGAYNPVVSDTLKITDAYIPVNSTTLHVAGGGNLSQNDRVFILRPSTAEWIKQMGCDIFGGGISAISWKPSDIDMRWDRTIAAADGTSLTLDAPLTMALDSQWAETVVLPYSWTGRI